MKIIKNIPAKILASQCVFPKLITEEYFSDKDYQENIFHLVELGVGGFCIFGGTMKTTEKMITELQKSSNIPLLFSADFEFGLPMRLKDGTAFPHAMALGKCNDSDITFNVAQAIAKEAKSIGILWNFAPVCDINSNPQNPIINIRSFGINPEIVIKHSKAFIEGTQSENILACAKHFPGHGDTSIDSHLNLPILNFNEDRIEKFELHPFIEAIKSGVKSIMVGHLAVPALDESGVPASLSPIIITKLLREKLKYEGLIVTDALDMLSITNSYSSGDAAIKAISAGADIALMPENPLEAIDTLEELALKDETFFLKLLSSVNKIIDSKKWCGLLDKDFDIKKYFSTGNKIQSTFKKGDKVPFDVHDKLALKAAFNGLEIHGNSSMLPIPKGKIIGGFAFLQTDDIEMPTLFFKFLAQAIDNDCDFGFIDETITDDEIKSFSDSIKNVDILLLAFFYRARAYKGSAGIPERLKDIANKLSIGKNVIVILFGNPYLENDIKADTYILPYTDTIPGVAASILVLSGREIPKQ
ncbi:MAG: glycoside hydrolase family 3 protein [FCB group bacterium]|jgi:beta-glucosidase-like glycosyl hydrolase